MHIKSNYKQLQPEERVTLASLRQQDFTTAAMTKVLGRAPSTITLNRFKHMLDFLKEESLEFNPVHQLRN